MKIPLSYRTLLFAALGFVFWALFEMAGFAQVGVPPVITNQPSDKIVLNNDSVTFRVGASSATTMSYKWYYNSNLINGATANTYTIAQVDVDDVGFYQVLVTNAAGSTLSRAASLTVFPSNDIPIANNDVYTSGVLGVTIAAPGVLTNDVDVYPGTLTAHLLSNPSHGSVSFNANGSFTYSPNLLYTGTDSFTYRVKDGGTTILESNSSGGNTQEIKSDQAGCQSFRHGAAGGASYSVKKIVLRLSRRSDQYYNLKFSIGTGINSGAIAGSSYTIGMASISNTTDGASFQNYEIVYAAPVGPLTAGTTYYLNLDNSPGGSKVYVELANNSTYEKGTFYKGGSNDSKDMRFEIREETLSEAASVALYVGILPIAPVIVTQPADQQVISGSDVEFSVGLSDTLLASSYQWRFNGTNITDAQASSYVVTNVQARDVGYYSVKVSNLGGSITSANAALTIDTTPLVMSLPRHVSNDFKFQISGPKNGTYVIHSSTNLVTWTAIATNEITSGAWAFTDVNTFSENAAMRSYKVQVSPLNIHWLQP